MNGEPIVYTWNARRSRRSTSSTPRSAGRRAERSTTSPPGLNVKTIDAFGGKYSQFNTVDVRPPGPPAAGRHDQREPRGRRTTATRRPTTTSSTPGRARSSPSPSTTTRGESSRGVNVWLGDMDFGGANKFYQYQPSFGVVGVTNASGTSNYTDPSGERPRSSSRTTRPTTTSSSIRTGRRPGFAYVGRIDAGPVPTGRSATPSRAPRPTRTTRSRRSRASTTTRSSGTTPRSRSSSCRTRSTSRPRPRRASRRTSSVSGSNISIKVNVQLPIERPVRHGVRLQLAARGSSTS